MSAINEDDDSNGIVAWVLGLAVLVAISVALWFGLGAALDGGEKPSSDVKTAMAPVAPKITEVDIAPAVAVGAGYPETVSLFFDSGKINTPIDASKQLEAIVAWSKTGPNTKIGLSGYHDTSGDPAANILLAKNRALGVREILVSAGVAEDRIVMIKPRSSSGGGGADDKQARRVDIYPAQ